MPPYSYLTQTIEPAPAKDREPRPVGLIATVLGLALALAWPTALGIVTGVAGWAFTGETWPLRWLPAVGLAAGVVLSTGALLGSYLLGRVIYRAPAPAVPNQITMSFDGPPLEVTTNHVIVPLRTHRVLIEGVPVQDLCWFVVGLTDNGMPLSQRAWLGLRAPSGGRVDSRYWACMVKPLRISGIVAEMSHRKTGRLTLADREGVLRILGLDPYDPALYNFANAADTEAAAARWRVRRGELSDGPSRTVPQRAGSWG